MLLANGKRVEAIVKDVDSFRKEEDFVVVVVWLEVGLGLLKEEEAVVVVGFVLWNKLFSSCGEDPVLFLFTTKGDAKENSLEGKALHRTMPPSLSRR